MKDSSSAGLFKETKFDDGGKSLISSSELPEVLAVPFEDLTQINFDLFS